MRQITLAIAFLFVLSQTSQVAGADPLVSAMQLAATKFKDWQYGANPSKMQIDCVQLVLAAVEEATQSTLKEEVRNGILISNFSKSELKPEKLAGLVQANDVRTKGLQSAVVGADLAMEIAPEDARPGDLIQHWMRQEDGTWFGHSGILDEVFTSSGKPQATIYGSHRSQNGIGVSKFKLSLTGDPQKRRIYLARLK